MLRAIRHVRDRLANEFIRFDFGTDAERMAMKSINTSPSAQEMVIKKYTELLAQNKGGTNG